MSPRGSSERIAFLRDTIARLERDGGPPREAAAGAQVPLGAAETEGHPLLRLDRALGGGAARAALHEVVPEKPADVPAATCFALALAARFARHAGGTVFWIIEDFAAREWGAPYAPGLALGGLDPERLVIVRATETRDALWALEETLKCRASAAVVGELWGSARLYDLAATRRLGEAARTGGAPAILLHPALPADTSVLTSGARGRFAVAAARSRSPWSVGEGARRPLPGASAFAVRLLKVQAQAGRAVAFDPDRIHQVIWNPQEGFFGDALPLHLAEGSADGRAARRA